MLGPIITFTCHVAAAINEPNASSEANVFAQASVVEAIGFATPRYSLSLSSVSSRVLASRPVRSCFGSPCADQLIDGLRLSSPRKRVELVLSDGRRVADTFTNCRWVGATLAVTNGTRHKAEEEMISVTDFMNGLRECTFHDLLRSSRPSTYRISSGTSSAGNIQTPHGICNDERGNGAGARRGKNS